MDYFNEYSCSSGGVIKDFLKCAPCPPPMLNYLQLKTAAIGKLCQNELCSIARRCRMTETSDLTLDCPSTATATFIASTCDFTCIILIASMLIAALLVILIIVIVRKRKGHLQQDIINVVFNDTDSESSRNSSDKGSVCIKKKQANGSEYGLTRRLSKASQKLEEVHDQETCEGANEGVYDEITVVEYEEKGKVNKEIDNPGIVAKM